MKPGDLLFTQGSVIVAKSLSRFEKMKGPYEILPRKSPVIVLKSFVVTMENKKSIMCWSVLCARGVYYVREITIKGKSLSA